MFTLIEDENKLSFEEYMLSTEKKTFSKMTAMNKKYFASLLVPLALVVGLSGCGKDSANNAGSGQQQLPQVGYITVQASDVGLITELPARLQAYRVADVRARVAGIVQKRLFEEGSDVEEGQQLYQIDNAPYRADLQNAQAQLAQAQASLLQTKAQAQRYKPLVSANAVSKQDYDNAVAAQKTSEANILAAQAAITNAKINLGYAAVTSPIPGRIGRSLVTEGALVGQGSATELAVVQQIDKLYVNITQSATEHIKLKEALNKGQFKTGSSGELPITIILDDGTVYPKEASMMFTDWTVDEATGQVTLRALLENKDKMLLPGLYVRVRLQQAKAENAFLVPQLAVTRGSGGDTLYVIAEKDLLELRPITISGRNGNNWVVTDGLKPGDRVVVDGLQGWQRATQIAMLGYAKKMQAYEEAKHQGNAQGEPPARPNIPVKPIDTTQEAKLIEQQNTLPSQKSGHQE